MNLDALVSITIDEKALIPDLIKEIEGASAEEIIDWVSTKDGETWLYEWINNHADSIGWNELDDYSYQEVLDYIEDNLEDYIDN